MRCLFALSFLLHFLEVQHIQEEVRFPISFFPNYNPHSCEELTMAFFSAKLQFPAFFVVLHSINPGFAAPIPPPGMNYLHTLSPPVVHRDLKSPNVLVNDYYMIKLCDFGMSRTKQHTMIQTKQMGV